MFRAVIIFLKNLLKGANHISYIAGRKNKTFAYAESDPCPILVAEALNDDIVAVLDELALLSWTILQRNGVTASPRQLQHGSVFM